MKYNKSSCCFSYCAFGHINTDYINFATFQFSHSVLIICPPLQVIEAEASISAVDGSATTVTTERAAYSACIVPSSGRTWEGLGAGEGGGLLPAAHEARSARMAEWIGRARCGRDSMQKLSFLGFRTFKGVDGTLSLSLRCCPSVSGPVSREL
ncbi:hypothetical protein EVAR_5424_1 [Eumeta japonica]|uniref:Uncharacterized protein n=1 Tax=Eumeta variegata TaxID=151549 RepID=A0A4C1T8T2_EUMVA|nr:hypothetical protein EVAR_5424_1 [Eumeta japonica]